MVVAKVLVSYIFVYNFYNKNTKEATGAAALPLYYKNYLKHKSSANYNVMRGKGNRKKDDEVMDNYTYKDRNGTADPIEVEKWNRGEFSWFCTRDTIIDEDDDKTNQNPHPQLPTPPVVRFLELKECITRELLAPILA